MCMETKICYRCHESKDIELFVKAKQYKSGRSNMCKKCHSTYQARYNKEHFSDKRWTEKVYRRHGLSEDEYSALYAKFDGKCWLCKERQATEIDHDHSCCSRFSCGKCIRGMLCQTCNLGLGMFGDSLDGIMMAVVYLERSNVLPS